MAAALRATRPTELLGATAICSSRGLSTCTPLLPPDRLRKGRLASGAITPFTRRVSSTSTPWVPPVTVSTLAAGSQRSSGACTRRSLSICCVQVMELLLVKAPVAAVEPTKNWAKSAVVALSVRSERTVISCSSPILPAAKLASSVPSSARIVVVAFWICRSAAALCSRGVWTKLVAVREFTVRSAVGATPGLFSRAVTRPSMDVTVFWRELKVATSG